MSRRKQTLVSVAVLTAMIVADPYSYGWTGGDFPLPVHVPLQGLQTPIALLAIALLVSVAATTWAGKHRTAMGLAMFEAATFFVVNAVYLDRDGLDRLWAGSIPTLRPVYLLLIGSAIRGWLLSLLVNREAHGAEQKEQTHNADIATKGSRVARSEPGPSAV